MPALIGLSNVGATVNNVPIDILPDSAKFTEGLGVQNVRAMSAGAGSITNVATEDVKTQIGKMSFDIAVTQTNRQYFATWKANIGANGVIFADLNGNQVVGNNMSCTSDPDWTASADGKVTIEFAGDPLLPA